jgi:hypothetical protein
MKKGVEIKINHGYFVVLATHHHVMPPELAPSPLSLVNTFSCPCHFAFIPVLISSSRPLFVTLRHHSFTPSIITPSSPLIITALFSPTHPPFIHLSS